jgi:DNA polymerase/3'-5' exonuclease PolX
MSKATPEVIHRTELSLADGKQIAIEVIERIRPFCERIEVAGSIRRQRPVVNDVDIVVIPSDLIGLVDRIRGPGNSGAADVKILHFLHKNVAIDIYIASHQSWATLLLIRTGSREHNIALAARAKTKGWQLKANGEGLLNEGGMRIAGDTEYSIYSALGMQYLKPEQRY